MSSHNITTSTRLALAMVALYLANLVATSPVTITSPAAAVEAVAAITPEAETSPRHDDVAQEGWINTATVTCLHEACIHGTSYCWYWPTMAVGMGSLGAEPSFTLEPFATCVKQQPKET